MDNANDLYNKQIVDSIKEVLNKYAIPSLASRMLVLDLSLLSLVPNQENGMSYINTHKIYPGYSRFFAMFGLMSCDKILDQYGSVSLEDMAFMSRGLDKIIEHALKKDGVQAAEAMYLAQRDWQKDYLMKTYLLSLLLNNNKIKPIYESLNTVSIDDIVSLCLLVKLSSETSVLKSLVENNIQPHVFFENILKYIVSNINYVIIEIDDYKAKQNNKLSLANYNPFYTRPLVKDYPVVHIARDLYVFSSYFYLQDAIFSRTIREIADGGKNSKIIGDAYEEVMYEAFEKMYAFSDVNTLGEKTIYLNPHTKKSGELCDILIKQGDKYLLIDCKAKELIEEIFQNNSSELEVLKEKFEQRIKRIDDIKNNKFSTVFKDDVSIDNVYSIIALVDDGVYSKGMLFDSFFSDLSEEEKIFYCKHIHLISFSDLLGAIVSQVNLIEVIENSNNSKEKYTYHLSQNITNKRKKKENAIFDRWYKKAAGKAAEFVVNNRFIEKH